jgi:O-antigen ligase
MSMFGNIRVRIFSNFRIAEHQVVLGALLSVIFLAVFLLWSFWGRTELIGLFIAGVVCLYTLFRYPILGAIYTAILHSTPLYSIHWGIGFLSLLIVLAGLFIRRLYDGEPLIKVTASIKWMILFFAWYIVSVLWATDYERFKPLELLRVVIIVLILMQSINSYNSALIVIAASIFAGVVSTILVISDAYQFFFSGIAAEAFKHAASLKEIRFFGGWGGPNELGQTMAPIAAFAYPFFRARIRSFFRWIFLVCFIILVAGVFITLSRGAILMLLVQIVIILLVEKRRKLLLASFAVLFFILVAFLPVNILDRIGSAFKGRSDASISQRMQILEGGVEITEDSFPFGVGYGNYYTRIPDYAFFMDKGIISHNTFLDVISETGIVGLFFFIGLILSMYSAIRIDTWNINASNLPEILHVSMFAVFVSITVAYLFNSHLFFWPHWVPLALVSSFPFIRSKKINPDDATKSF